MADLIGLTELERAANSAALAHVFPPEQFPYPFDDVCARWSIVLDDPGCRVDVVATDDDGVALLGFVAYDRVQLRHLAVHPTRFGDGLAVGLLRHAEHRMRALGTGVATLWVLADNTRARRFYHREGWQVGQRQQQCEWPPHPVELEYCRELSTVTP